MGQANVPAGVEAIKQVINRAAARPIIETNHKVATKDHQRR